MNRATAYNPSQRFVSVLCILLLTIEVIAPLAYIGRYNTAKASSSAIQSDLVVAATGGDLVDPFTGDFNYSIPLGAVVGTHGLDFPITLSYTSGQTVESDASFVGWGWSTGFGAINRFVNGYPDDACGYPVKKYMEDAPITTIDMGFPLSQSFEFMDIERTRSTQKNEDGTSDPDSIAKWKFSASLSGGIGFKYNTRYGWSHSWSFGFSIPGVNSSLNFSNGRTGFSTGLSFGRLIQEASSFYIDNKKDREFLDRYRLLGLFSPGGRLYPANSNLMALAPSMNTAKRSMEAYQVNISLQLGILPFGISTFSPYATYTYSQTMDRGASGYGVMYLAEGLATKYRDGRSAESADENVDLDYGLENEKEFYPDMTPSVGLAFLSYDSWNVSGYGPAGSFEAVREDIGTVEPQKTSHKSSEFNISPEFRIGLGASWIGVEAFSVGFSLPFNPRGQDPYFYGGFGDLSSYNQGSERSSFLHNNGVLGMRNDGKQNPVRFMYVGDMGASSHQVLPARTRQDELMGNSDGRINEDAYWNMRSGRSWHTPTKTIEYRTFEELFPSNSSGHRSFSVRRSLASLTEYEVQELEKKKSFLSSYYGGDSLVWHKMIAQMSVTDEAGRVYIYSLPVLSMAEQQISIGPEYNSSGILQSTFDINSVYGNRYYGVISGFANTSYSIDGNTIPGPSVDITTMRSRFGEARIAPYVSSFLLTQIHSPEFTDVDLDGPDADDIGGYLTFTYQQRQTGRNDCFTTWQSPYLGGTYTPGLLSDQFDDKVSFKRGIREEYYPYTVSSKISKAYYILNTTSDADAQMFGTSTLRKDGLPNRSVPFSSSYSRVNLGMPTTDLLSHSSNTDDRPSYLERIEVYTVSSTGEEYLNQTAHLRYDYSLAPAQYSSEIDPSSGERAGKLTLKKVWVESNGVKESRIIPYEFSYAGISSAPSDLDAIQQSFFAGQNPTFAQNPRYSPLKIDPWGYYDPNGFPLTNNPGSPELFEVGLHVRSQRDGFVDPGAWNLRRIDLPTGGQIHITYEHKRYTHVQNRPVEGLVRLSSATDDVGGYGGGAPGNIYRLDLSSLGSSVNSAMVQRLKKMIDDLYVNSGDYIYFRFYYNLPPQSSTLYMGLDYPNTPYEVIEGFAKVHSAAVSGLSIDLKLGPRNMIRRVISPNDGVGKVGSGSQPISLAQAFAESRPHVTENDAPVPSQTKSDSIRNGISSQLSKVSHRSGSDWDSYTPLLRPEKSFIRIPLPKPKIGGGIRVNSMITYSPGTAYETGAASAYGLRFEYSDSLEGDYGVATNEPTAFRYDNALYRIANPNHSSLGGRAVSGENISQFVYIDGESQMPGPSVGHRRVIAHNLYTNRSTPGHTIYNYHTVLTKPSLEVRRDGRRGSPNDPDGLKAVGSFITQTSNVHKENYESGLYIQNSLHGRLISRFQYPGAYDRAKPEGRVPPTSAEEYEYYPQFTEVPVLYGINRPLRKAHLGVRHKVCLEDKSSYEYRNTSSVQVSLSIASLPPWVHPSGSPNLGFDFSSFRQVAVSHVVSQPPIVKSVTTIKDGVKKIVENKVFDPYTSQALVTTYQDAYDGLILPTANDTVDGTYWQVTIPAHLMYDKMRPKSEVTRKVFTTTSNSSKNHWPHFDVSYRRHPTDNTKYRITFSRNLDMLVDDPSGYAEYAISRKEILSTFALGDHLSIGYISRGYNQHYTTNDLYRKPFTIDGFVSSIVDTDTNSVVIDISNVAWDEHYHWSTVNTPPDEVVPANRQSLTLLRSTRQNALSLPGDSWLLYGMTEWFQDLVDYADVLHERDRFGKSVEMMIDNRYGGHPFNVVNNNSVPSEYAATYGDNTLLAYRKSSDSIFDVSYRAWQFRSAAKATTYWSIFPYDTIRINPYIRHYVAIVNDRKDVYFGFRDSKPSNRGWPSWSYDNTKKFWDRQSLYKGWYHRRFGADDEGRFVAYSSYRHPELMTYQPALDFRGNLSGAESNLVVLQQANDSTCSVTKKAGVTSWSTAPRWKFFDTAHWNVITAQAQTYEKMPTVPIGSLLPIAQNYKEVWRPRRQYLLRDFASTLTTFTGARPAHRGYGSVTSFVNRSSSVIPAGWILNSTVQEYNSQGVPILEYNRLQTPAAIRTDARTLQSDIQAYNAKPGEIAFQSYERSAYSATRAHSGKQSLAVPKSVARGLGITFSAPTSTTLGGSAPVTSRMRMWISGLSVTNNYASQLGSISLGSIGSLTISDKRHIALVKGWHLVEFTLQQPSTPYTTPVTPTLSFSGSSLADTLYVDDVVVSPTDAEVSAVVYDDKTLLRLATFDTQHFGVFTQYDARRIPVRTYRETERGLLLLTEKHHHVPGKDRATVMSGVFLMNGSGVGQPEMHSGQQMMRGVTQDTSARNSVGAAAATAGEFLQDNKAQAPNIPSVPGLRAPSLGAKGELLDIRLTPEQSRLRVFGVERSDTLGSQRSKDTVGQIPKEKVKSTDKPGGGR